MNDPRDNWVTHLQRRAAHCRRMAGAATSPGIAEELLGLAQSYEDEAIGIVFKGADDRTGMMPVRVSSS
jgi:hypothetical protein